MKWWKDSRFGMFIHWGLYSIPAGKWGNSTNHAEWIRETAHIPLDEYENFQKQFNPTKFDANQWAKLAKEAGMKYVVITTKHHDGFNLFFSKYTDWSVKNTPFHRDIMRELSTAVRKQGLTMGWYHSIMDWHHPDYLPRRTWEEKDRPATGAKFDRFVQYLRNDVSQLLTEYGPIGVMWFDGEWESTWNTRYGDALYALCRQKQPNVIVNNRVSVGRAGTEDGITKAGDYGTPEQSIPDTGIPGQSWETCMTMNGNWGYNAADYNWKSTQTLVRNLIDIASKGGNYLLNIGPRADGTFPPEAVQRLHEIGAWMKVNGDSIYGTDASLFDHLSWGRSTTKVDRNGSSIYLQVFDFPKDGRIVVPGIGNRPISARVLGVGGSLPVTRRGTDLVVQLSKPSNAIATVVELKLKGKPVVYKPPVINAESDLVVDKETVRITGPISPMTVRYTVDGTEPTSNSPIYLTPISIDGTQTLRAATFEGRVRVSQVVAQKFTRVIPDPAVQGISLKPGLIRRVFFGAWEKVPDFNNLVCEKKSTTTSFEFPSDSGKPMENIGLQYFGCILVPKSGVYRFELTSDDGSKLSIDGHLSIDNDGVHAAQAKTVSLALAKGPHYLELDWFNRTGGAALGLRYGLTGQPLRNPAPRELGHPE